MRHLIVEACIARNLLDTSAYFWRGYVNGCISQMPQSIPPQAPGWSAFMKGAPLNHIMINALTSTPASRYTHSNEPTFGPFGSFLFCLDIGSLKKSHQKTCNAIRFFIQCLWWFPGCEGSLQQN